MARGNEQANAMAGDLEWCYWLAVFRCERVVELLRRAMQQIYATLFAVVNPHHRGEEGCVWLRAHRVFTAGFWFCFGRWIIFLPRGPGSDLVHSMGSST